MNRLARSAASTLVLAAFCTPVLAGAQSSARPAATRIRVIATGDLHGSLAPYVDSRGYRSGGLSGLAAAVEQARRECVAPACVAVLVDAGDIFSGTPESDLTHGREAVDALALLRYDAIAPGNHEFDWGVDTLGARIRGAKLPIFGANVQTTKGAPLPWLRSDTLIRRGGVAIGIIGVASQLTPQATNPDSVAGLVFEDPAAAVDARAKALRGRGARVVIVVSHSGVRCEGNLYGVATGAPSDRCEGEALGAIGRLERPVDLYIGGHTHQKAIIVMDSTLFVSAGANGRSISVIDIPLDATGHALAGRLVASARNVDERLDAPHVRAIDSIVATATARATAYLAEPVATIAESLERTGSQYALGNLITDAQRWAGHGDLAVTNTTGIHASLAAGVATNKAVYDVQPFGNILYRLSVPGAAVRAYLEAVVGGNAIARHISGVTVVFDPSRPAGSRITELRLADGRAIEDSATYTVIMNDYVRPLVMERVLGDAVLDMSSLPMNDRDAFIAYLKQLPQPVRASSEIRIREATAAAKGGAAP